MQSSTALEKSNNKPLSSPKNTPSETIQEALRLYGEGMPVKLLAEQIGITDVSLYKLFLRHYPDEFRELQGANALSKLQNAEDELEKVETMALVSRAQARIKAHQWRLERVLSKLYGAKQELTLNTQPVMNVYIAAPGESVTIDASNQQADQD